ncbi:uncharacterized protein BJ171DRAFT_493013 [Polychytrium aggregatum]|uniref:uncharacterized protein n=1 Tax=Polychytrium aggregatum TaxID=110093 RepID=UPI0022FEBA91|nr:uncharacterized protein BJ171DRAFT_493013 [Polychytrium aggregatum]KAI9207556.1 hypothetical protein BJ171DRAFT_493013 [Polychytrium aggregatum]
MSTINYSKWDKIELSDDDDFECHPNVDKGSMIRWKQADIHKQRRERKDKSVLLQMEMDLAQKAFAMIKDLIPLQASAAETQFNPADFFERLQKLSAEFERLEENFRQETFAIVAKDRDARWGPVEPIPFCQKRMPLNAMLRIVMDVMKASKENNEATGIELFVRGCDSLEQTISQRAADIKTELLKDEIEAGKKLTSENMYKEGFSRTVLAQHPEAHKEPAKEPAKPAAKEKVIETIHTPSKPAEVEPTEAQDAGEEDDGNYITNADVRQFAELNDFDASFKFLAKHKYICTQEFSDEILAEAFKRQMNRDPKGSQQCVQQSLILQYVALLGQEGAGVPVFFQRLQSPSHSARQMFFQDVTRTYDRIVERVEVLRKRNLEEQEQERQAALARLASATQPDGTIKLPLSEDPDEQELRRAEVFDGLDPRFQKALLLQDVDLINEYLGTLNKEESKEILDLCQEAGLMALQMEDDPESSEAQA